MKIEKQKRMKLSALTPNADNPRYIKEKDFEDLKRSITNFPEMMEARPIVVDGDTNNTILGGNMRFKAVSELGWTDVPVVVITGATEEQKREFIIKDNIQKGSWDWDALANKWDEAELADWGFDHIKPTDDFDANDLYTEDGEAKIVGNKIVLEYSSEEEAKEIKAELLKVSATLEDAVAKLVGR